MLLLFPSLFRFPIAVSLLLIFPLIIRGLSPSIQPSHRHHPHQYPRRSSHRSNAVANLVIQFAIIQPQPVPVYFCFVCFYTEFTFRLFASTPREWNHHRIFPVVVLVLGRRKRLRNETKKLKKKLNFAEFSFFYLFILTKTEILILWFFIYSLFPHQLICHKLEWAYSCYYYYSAQLFTSQIPSRYSLASITLEDKLRETKIRHGFPDHSTSRRLCWKNVCVCVSVAALCPWVRNTNQQLKVIAPITVQSVFYRLLWSSIHPHNNRVYDSTVYKWMKENHLWI